MDAEQFNPINLERRLMDRGALPPDQFGPAARLGEDEQFFTEGDRRLYALWRISRERQFQPTLLRSLPDTDLLFLAGQSPAGYPANGTGEVDLGLNKVTQNSERARIELDRRARRTGLWHNVVTGVVGAVVGAILTIVGANLGPQRSERSTPTTTSTLPVSVTNR
jgi:hypothetical protein